MWTHPPLPPPVSLAQPATRSLERARDARICTSGLKVTDLTDETWTLWVSLCLQNTLCTPVAGQKICETRASESVDCKKVAVIKGGEFRVAFIVQHNSVCNPMTMAFTEKFCESLKISTHHELICLLMAVTLNGLQFTKVRQGYATFSESR